VSLESESAGYAAIVKAAAKIATSPIVSREAQREAEDFVMAEIDRWAEGSGILGDDDPAQSEPGDEGGPVD
jgi:hypothetical protein